jgi:hypothetical protein
MINPVKQLGLFTMLLCLFIALPAYAQDPVGKITYLKGKGWVQDGYARKSLRSGSIVYVGDELHTGQDSSIYLRFLDQTFFTLGPKAKMVIDNFDEREEAETSFAASILQGAFRFVSGLLAKKEPKKYSVGFTVGTIGVRGTNVAGEVFERVETEDGIVEASAQIMLLESEDGAASAIEVSNAYGSVVIDEPGFGTEIADEHSPPSTVRRMQIRSVNNLLRAIRNTTRSSTQKRKLP